MMIFITLFENNRLRDIVKCFNELKHTKKDFILETEFQLFLIVSACYSFMLVNIITVYLRQNNKIKVFLK